ncbi:MAG: hypothetical protein AB1568_14925 [Thermodesulfobacteriota bacterium]
MTSGKSGRKAAIREELLARAAAGDVRTPGQLPADWLHEEFLPSLSAREARAVEEVLAEMIAEGLIEHVHVHGRRPTFRLTARGRTALTPE